MLVNEIANIWIIEKGIVKKLKNIVLKYIYMINSQAIIRYSMIKIITKFKCLFENYDFLDFVILNFSHFKL